MKAINDGVKLVILKYADGLETFEVLSTDKVTVNEPNHIELDEFYFMVIGIGAETEVRINNKVISK